MKRTHLIAVLAGVVAMSTFAADASAYYHPSMGRFTSRDPGAGSEIRLNAAIAAPVSRFIPHDQYRDGPNLYQYVRSKPSSRLDPTGQRFVTVDHGPAVIWELGGVGGTTKHTSDETPPIPHIVRNVSFKGDTKSYNCAQIGPGTGVFDYTDEFWSVKTGDQGPNLVSQQTGKPITVYIDPHVGEISDQHEQTHVALEKAAYELTIGKAEAAARAYWGRYICCCSNKVSPADVLLSIIAWKERVAEFYAVTRELGRPPNWPDDPEDRGGRVDAVWIANQPKHLEDGRVAGPREGKNYDLVETTNMKGLVDYSSISVEKMIAEYESKHPIPQPLTCDDQKEAIRGGMSIVK